MGKNTQKALRKYTFIYTSYAGGAGALAAESIKNVYWFETLWYGRGRMIIRNE
ncbi:MAG: hypothetical protein V5A68_03230 [Candidatus Thermoplasmatota archaeon]